MIFELKMSQLGEKTIANSALLALEVEADLEIPEGCIGILSPAPTYRQNNYYVVTCDIAPGLNYVKPGKYKHLTVTLWNNSGISMRYTNGSVVAQLVIVSCDSLLQSTQDLELASTSGQATGTGSLSSDSPSLDSSSQNTTASTDPGSTATSEKTAKKKRSRSKDSAQKRAS